MALEISLSESEYNKIVFSPQMEFVFWQDKIFILKWL